MSKLTDIAVKTAQPDPNKRTKKFDGEGLYLEVTKTGAKYWRLKYRFEGDGRELPLGVYPQVSLKDARKLKTFYRAQIGYIHPNRRKYAVGISPNHKHSN